MRPPRIYALADLASLGERGLPAAVAAMAEAGMRWIQVRAKGASGLLAWRIVEECCRLLEGSPATLWVDDRADLAAVLPVGGLHLGQHDLPPGAARRLLGVEPLLGLSTHGREQLAAAEADAAVDVVAVGPVFPTRSKADPDPVVGLALVREARSLTTKPLVAIGGIDETNVASVLAAGADTAAVLSAISPTDVVGSCRRLLQAAGGAGKVRA